MGLIDTKPLFVQGLVLRRQQAIAWTNDDLALGDHTASQSLNELTPWGWDKRDTIL